MKNYEIWYWLINIMFFVFVGLVRTVYEMWKAIKRKDELYEQVKTMLFNALEREQKLKDKLNEKPDKKYTS